VVIDPDEEGYYVATAPTLRGCHTQARTLDTLMKRVHKLSKLFACGHPTDLGMTRLPRVKDPEIVRVLEGIGLTLCYRGISRFRRTHGTILACMNIFNQTISEGKRDYALGV